MFTHSIWNLHTFYPTNNLFYFFVVFFHTFRYDYFAISNQNQGSNRGGSGLDMQERSSRLLGNERNQRGPANSLRSAGAPSNTAFFSFKYSV